MKWRVPVGIIAAILLLWGGLPFVVAGILNVGVITPVTLGVVGLLAAIYDQRTERMVQCLFRGRAAVRTVSVAVTAVIALLVLLFLAVSVVMVCNATRTTTETNVTLLVPGAKVKGDRPTLMLQGRLEAAVRFLNEHPTVPCVVSGGQGEDEMCSEAQVMYEYLLEAGIAPDRLFVEDTSVNTFENMQYTYDVIRQNGLSEQVVIATQEFHQFRCAQYAREAALQPVGTATCGTPWYFFLCYWVREFAGICRMWILGY